MWEASVEWDLPIVEGRMQICRFISKGEAEFLLSVICPCDLGKPPRRLGEDLPFPESPGS